MNLYNLTNDDSQSPGRNRQVETVEDVVVVASLPREGSCNKLQDMLPAGGLLHLDGLLVLVNQLSVLVSLVRGVQGDGSPLSLLLVQESHQPDKLIPSVRTED